MMSISSSRTVARHNPIQIYYPLSTVRCVGPVLFRDQLPRDIGCLRDVDDDVAAWSCQSLPLTESDFVVKRADVSFAIDGLRDDAPPPWVREAGHAYELIESDAVPYVRLKNAKDLLRYARHEAALSDRIRVLAALDEHSSLTVAEALMVFRETSPSRA